MNYCLYNVRCRGSITKMNKWCVLLLVSVTLALILYFNPTGKDSIIGPLSDESTQNVVPHPYALSFIYVKYLSKIEEDLHEIFRNYKPKSDFTQEIVSRYVRDYEDSSLKVTAYLEQRMDSMERAVAVVSNPLMAYRLIRRFATEIDCLLSNSEDADDTDLKEKLEALKQVQYWPKADDLKVAINGILRSYYIYDFNLKEMTSGIWDKETNVGLTARQTLEIAEHAASSNSHSLALDWLRVTDWKLNSSGKVNPDPAVNVDKIAEMYRSVVLKHNQELQSSNKPQNYYSYTSEIVGPELPAKLRDVAVDTVIKGDKLDWEEYQELEDIESDAYDHFNYITLCNGHNKQTESEKAELYCYYEQSKNPYWYINPLKTEILNLDPLLIQMYEFIGDKWIDHLIEKATPISRPPPVLKDNATHRSAAYAWLNDSDIPEIPLSRRIELITGLHVIGKEASTELQIASYIFGGHVDVHVDSLGESEISNLIGDRVTTFLIYLNDVGAGGYTAFPFLGTFAQPIKGSAILWYDALENGEADYRMLHGACPPIFGYKWIATKWTHLNKNFLKRPCSLDSDY